MSFDDLPPMPAFPQEAANAYDRRVSDRAREVMETHPCKLDIPYGADYWQKLDIYYPFASERHQLPVMVFYHGGGWLAGCKEWIGFQAPAITETPALLVAPSYRRAPDNYFPDPAEDAADALAWVWRHIAAHGGNPDRIIVSGHSAGGHLAALITLRPELLTERGLPVDAIKGCAPVSGIFDVLGHPMAEANLIRSLDDRAAASPIFHTRNAIVPMHVVYGDADNPPQLAQNPEMIAALEAAGCSVTHHKEPGANHFDTHERLADPDNDWVGRMRLWLRDGP